MRILEKNIVKTKAVIISVALLMGVLAFAPAHFGVAVYAEDRQIQETQEETSVPSGEPASDVAVPDEEPSSVVTSTDEDTAPVATSTGGESGSDDTDPDAEQTDTGSTGAEEVTLREYDAGNIIKFTDDQGNLLKLSDGSDSVFTAFEDAVSALNSNNVHDQSGAPYTGHVNFELLVDLVETPATNEPATFENTLHVTFRTASKTATDYPYSGTKDKAQITFMNGGSSQNTSDKRFVFRGAGSNIAFENIIVDGRADQGICGDDGGIINIGNSAGQQIVLTLSEGAVIQNGAANNNDQGGGIYVGQNCILRMEPGSVIQNCYATRGRDSAGGAVYLENAEFYCDGGIIRNCVSMNGGGVYLGGRKPGIQSDRSRIYLSGSSQIIDNSDLSGNMSNVFLNYDSNMVINVIGTLPDDAQIGIFPASQGSVYSNHGHECQPFATIEDGIDPGNLGAFVNDRDERLTGERGTLDDSLVVWSYEMNAQAFEDFMRNGSIIRSSLIDGSTGKFRPGTLPTSYSVEEIADAYKSDKGFVVSSKSVFDHLVLEKYGSNAEVSSGITNIRYTTYLHGRIWEYSTDGGSTWNNVNGREFTFHYSRDIMNTIKYDPNGGNWDGSEDPLSFEEEYDTTIKIYRAPVREGYDFLYWMGSEYQPGDEYRVTDDHTFTAQWKKKDKPVDPVNPVDPVDPDDPVNPGGGGGGGNPPGNGGGATAAPAAAAPAAGNTVVADNDVPLDDGEDIIDEPVPQAAPEGYWALVNLICTVLTVLGAIVLAMRRKKDDEEDEDGDMAGADEEDEDDADSGKRKMCKIGAALSAVASIVALLLTEDFTLPMRMVDRYTILMVVITAFCAVSMLLHRRFNRGQEEDEE